MKNPDEPKVMLDDQEIENTAQLVALQLEPGDRQKIREGMETILDHFAVIRNATTDENIAGSPVEKAVEIDQLRKDEPSLKETEKLKEAAPDFDEGWFFVPRVVE